jgi:hypothetical protein
MYSSQMLEYGVRYIDLCLKGPAWVEKNLRSPMSPAIRMAGSTSSVTVTTLRSNPAMVMAAVLIGFG